MVTEVCHLLADPQRRGRPSLAAEFCAAIAEDDELDRFADVPLLDDGRQQPPVPPGEDIFG